MSKFDYYGVGNALVDLEIRVTDQQLVDLNLAKGAMTLIDLDTANRYSQELASQIQNKACGGSATNTLVTASHLGAKSAYTCRVADDDWGRFYQQDLCQNGLVAELRRSTGQTGQCFVMVTEDAQRSMATYLGVSGDLDASDLDLDAIANSNCLYLEGYLFTSDSAKSAMQTAVHEIRKVNGKLAFSCSDPFIASGFKQEFKTVLGDAIDLLFANEREACEFAGVDNVQSAIPVLLQWSEMVAVTLGKKGALIASRGSQIEPIHTPIVTAVDTTGAGDAFAAGFLAKLCQGETPVNSAVFACELASKVVTVPGPRLAELSAIS